MDELYICETCRYFERHKDNYCKGICNNFDDIWPEELNNIIIYANFGCIYWEDKK